MRCVAHNFNAICNLLLTPIETRLSLSQQRNLFFFNLINIQLITLCEYSQRRKIKIKLNFFLSMIYECFE